VEKLVAMTDFNNDEACLRLQRVLSKMGLDEALRNEGAKDGDIIRIGKQEFDFVE
jgi:GTP-binding protein